MAIIDSLNNLQNNIASAKQTLATNISAKGVTTITTANTLTEMAVAVSTIEQSGGGTPAVLEELSVTENGEYVPKEGVDGYSKVTVNVEGASGDNYLISPESLAKCYDNNSDEHKKYMWDDNTNELFGLEDNKVIFAQPWNTFYYDTNDSSYHQQYKEDGSEYNTYSTEAVKEFYKYLKAGNMLVSANGEHKGIGDIEVSSNSGYINTNTETDYWGNEITYKYLSEYEFKFYGENEYGHDDYLSFTNPLNSSEYYFYPLFVPKGYYYKIFSEYYQKVDIKGGCNFVTWSSNYPTSKLEDGRLVVKADTSSETSIKAGYINLFVDDVWVKDWLLDLAGQIPFKRGFKKLVMYDSSNNHSCNIREIQGLETLDLTNLPSGEYNLNFYNCKDLKRIEFGNFKPKIIKSKYEHIFQGCESIESLDLSGWDTSSVTNLSSCFYDLKKMSSLNLSGWDTSAVTDLSYCFYGCSSLTDLSSISGWDTSSVTSLYGCFNGCSSLTDLNLSGWDTSAVTSLSNCFNECSSLTDLSSISGWDTSAVTNLSGCFSGCSKLTDLSSISSWNTSSVTNLSYCFDGCSKLEKIPPIKLDGVTKTSYLFNRCSSLNKIILVGDPSSIISINSMFRGVKENGTLIYDHRYDYTAIINQLKSDAPTWTAKPDYEAQECLSLSITADDVIGNATTTTVHYTAMTNGINSLTGERVEGIELKGDVTSEDFGENPSYTDSRQVTVSYSYMGQTATATITQTAKIRKTATVDLMGNWELAPSADVPNPNSNIYEGVFQSVHKGQGNAKDKMVITFTDMPNFELYIRSNGEAYYDYVFAGKLDQADPTEDNNQASTKGNQQAGTDLASYTKVEYPNDGGQHTVTVVYRKDSSGDGGTDRGYCFFPFANQQA